MQQKPRVIVISGPTNAGKSTVSRALAEKLRAACITGDTVRWFMPYIEQPQAFAVAYQAIATLVELFVKQGIKTIVVDYAYDDSRREELQRLLAPMELELYFITLSRSAEALHTDSADREYPLRETDHDRIDEQLTEGMHISQFGLALDSTTKLPGDTVDEILSYLHGRV